MKGDFTRWTFAPQKNYSSVLLQQGRVLLDADWNEQREIDLAARRQLAVDLIGDAAGPLGHLGYVVEAVDEVPEGAPDGVFEGLVLRSGRYYVDGILCELHSDTYVSAQPDLPEFDPLAGLPEGRYLVYLDVWERHVSYIEDEHIKEKALGGPDHTTRRQVVAQARLLDLDALELEETDSECDVIHSPAALADILDNPRGTMAASVDPAPPDLDPCIVPADAGYRGLENQLYRVEIHRGGNDGSVTFKWSRDNGSVVTQWRGHPDPIGEQKLIEVADLGPDGERTFNEANVLVELLDDSHQLLPGPGLLARVQSADEAARTINLKEIMDADGVLVPEPLPAGTIVRGDSENHPRVRRWDGGGVRRIDDVDADGWIDLEQGVRVQFDLSGAQNYRSGDYWLIPARTVDGTIEWEPDDFHPPHGASHRYACLAVVELDGSGWHVESQCQEAFPTADSLTQLRYAGGDGQQAVLADPAHVLPQPLRVQVLNGGVPVAGARVAFRIVTPPANDGSLRDLVGGGVGADIEATTDADGVARVEWTLASEIAWDAAHSLIDQQVRAVLLDECEEETSQVIVFSVHESQAVEVRYDNTVCAPMDALQGAGFDTDNVQAALNVLCENPHLSYVSGDGQESMPGDELPNDLVVRVGHGAFDHEGATVQFTLVDLATGADASDESWAGSLRNVQSGSSVDASWASTNPRQITVPTDADGYARVRRQLGATPGSERPGVIARLLMNHAPIPFDVFDSGAEVRFGGNWSLASHVHYTPACDHLIDAHIDTVQDALDALCSDRTLYYVGGTGQPTELGQTLPVPLSVRVANEGVPIEGARVRFTVVNLSSSGSVDENTGGTLDDTGPGAVVDSDTWGTGGVFTIDVQTNAAGMAQATWTIGVAEASGVAGVRANLLDAALAPTTSYVDFEAVLQTTAIAEDDGMHVRRTTMIERGGTVRALLNDSTVDPFHMLDGIRIHCDRKPEILSLRGKRTAYLSIEVPYGWNRLAQVENQDPYFEAKGVQHHDIHIVDGTVEVQGDTILWVPSTAARRMLVSTSPGPFASLSASGALILALANPMDWPLPLRLYLFGGGATRVRANLTIEGDFVVTAKDFDVHLDGETLGIPNTSTARIDLQFPSGDGRSGGDFRSWFWMEGRVWNRKVPADPPRDQPNFPGVVNIGVTPLGGGTDGRTHDLVVGWIDRGTIRTTWYDSNTETAGNPRSYGDGVAAEPPELWLRYTGGQPDGYSFAYRTRAGAPFVVHVSAAGGEDITELPNVLPRPVPAAELTPRGVALGKGEAVAWTGTDGALVVALHDGNGSWTATELSNELGASSINGILDALDRVHGRDPIRPDGESAPARSPLSALDLRLVEEATAAGRGPEALVSLAVRLSRANGLSPEETEALRTVTAELSRPASSGSTRNAWSDRLKGVFGTSKLQFIGELAVLADFDGTLHVLALARQARDPSLYWFSRTGKRNSWTGRDLTPELGDFQPPHENRLAAASGNDRSGDAVLATAWLTEDGKLLVVLRFGDNDWSTVETIDSPVAFDPQQPIAVAVDGEGVVHVVAASKDRKHVLDFWRDRRTPWTVTDLSDRASLDGRLSGLVAARSADGAELVVGGILIADRNKPTLHTAWLGLPQFKYTELVNKVG